jgi:hypothetical protein
MRKRVAVRWGIAGGIAAAALGHLGYWYLPRERGAVSPSPEAAALLADRGSPGAVWIAFPHQNLGRLERFVGDAGAWGALVVGRDRGGSRDRGEAERVPRFGPFVTPPSSELVLTLPVSGELPRALVRAYPSVARLARAAGRLAGNPWLSGGAIEEDGSTRTVEWDGDLWLYGGPGEAVASPLELPATEPAPLALLRTATRLGPLPPGTYRLLRDEEGLELRLGGRLEQHPRLPEGPDRPVVLLIERSARRHLSMLLIWGEDGVAPPFPASASIVRRGTPRPRLAGEELLRLAGRKPKRELVEGYEISGLSTREVERARGLLPELLALSSQPASARAVAIVDPARLLGIARRLSDGFAAFPLAALFGVDPERWTELLGPWEQCGTVALVVSKQADAARVWLCPPAAPSPPSR